MDPSRKPRKYTVIASDADFLSEPHLEKLCEDHDNGRGTMLPHKCFTKETKTVKGERRVYRNNPCRDCERGSSAKVSIDEIRSSLEKVLAENKRLQKKVDTLDKKQKLFDKMIESISSRLDIEFDSDGDIVIQ